MAQGKKGKGKAPPKAKAEATPMDSEAAKVEVVIEATTTVEAQPADAMTEFETVKSAEDQSIAEESGAGLGKEDAPEVSVSQEDGLPNEAEEKVKADEEADKDKPDGKSKKKRFRKRGRKAIGGGDGDTQEEKKERKKVDFAGLIFLCNEVTKKDCFKYRVFGLPEAKKSIVERVKKNDKLFLFDIDKRVLYGVYKAGSAGEMNLVPEAFQNSGKKFPAQVKFRLHKECEPLDEEVFKLAIKENYFGRNKFNCELSIEQVQNLMKLFRRIDSRGAPEPATKPVNAGKPPVKGNGPKNNGPSRFAPKPRGGRAPPPPRPTRPYVRERPQYRDYAPAYSRETLPMARDVEFELEAQRRMQLRQLQAQPLDPLELAGRTRILDDPYAADRSLLAPKRPLYQDELYRDVLYSREPTYSGYADGLHAASAAVSSLPYGASAAWRYV